MFIASSFNRQVFLGTFHAALTLYEAMMEQKGLTFRRDEMVKAAENLRKVEHFNQFVDQLAQDYYSPEGSPVFIMSGKWSVKCWVCSATVQMVDKNEVVQIMRGNNGLVVETRRVPAHGVSMTHESVKVYNTSNFSYGPIPLFSFKTTVMERFFVRPTSTMSLILKLLATSSKGDNRAWFKRLSADWNQKFPA